MQLAFSRIFCFSFLIYHIGQDGAETGYGAKAQEVLGQVKGRYFSLTLFSLSFYLVLAYSLSMVFGNCC